MPFLGKRDDLYCGLSDIQISPFNVFETVSRFKPNKGSGPDGIHKHVVKEVGALCSPLYVLYRNLFDTGTLCENWGITNKCALHKKDNNTEANCLNAVNFWRTNLAETVKRHIFTQHLSFKPNTESL